jgi:subtilisin family serine protease
MKFLFYSRTKFFGILLGLSVLIFFFGCQKDLLDTGSIINPVNVTSTQVSIKSNNFIIITKSVPLPAGFETKLSPYGEIISSIPEIGEVVVKPTVSNFENKIAKLTEVQAVVPDLVSNWIDPIKFIEESNPPSIGDDETRFMNQWGMDAINAPEAWNAGYTGENAKVFILDSGIDAEHPDLASNLNTTLSTSFVPGEGYNVHNGLYFNHGTHVAGIIAAANNGYGVIGVAPDAEIVAVKVLSEYSGSGAFSWINEGIVYAADNGADVINMSLGATVNKNGFYYDENDVLQKVPAVYIQNLILAQQRAVNYAYKKGVVIVASAGNDYANADGNAALFILPAQLQHIIAVAATAPDYWYSDIMNGITDPDFDIPSSYTNYGKSLVDIAAPGGDFDYSPQPYYYYDMVYSTTSGGFAWAAGTSMASPHVAGVAALIIAKNGGKMTPEDVAQQLYKTADNIAGNGSTSYFGKGRVSAFRAVTE